VIEFITNLSIEYGFSQEVIIASFVSLFVMLIFIAILIFKIFEPKFKLYRVDMFHNVLWKWSYTGEKIVDLWCYCPKCKSMLHVDDENCSTTSNLGDKITFFVCHKCGECEVGRIKGGDRNYALRVVTREILAKIRLNTFDIYKYK